MPSREAEDGAPKSLSDSALDPVKTSANAAQARRLSEQAEQKPKAHAKVKAKAAADSAQKPPEAKAPRKTQKVPSPDVAKKLERTQRAKATSAASDEHAGERAAGSEAPERSEEAGAPARAVRTVVYGSADDPFLAAVMKSVEGALRFPRRARARGWSGTATLQVTVAADGTVGPIEVIESSGRALLDEAAVAAVERSRRTWRKPSHALRLQFRVRFALTP